MPRRARGPTGGIVYHVLNRAVPAVTLFTQQEDYMAFLRVLVQAQERRPIRLLAYCLMPTHWHMVLWPESDGDLPVFMWWLTLTHVQRWHAFHKTVGMGPLYRSRYKSFPVQTDAHFLTVCRYVERNPLRAGLVRRAENWPWSSLLRPRGGKREGGPTLTEWPVEKPREWTRWVNEPQTEKELEALRVSVTRGRPFGEDSWVDVIARRLGLECSLRRKGRPSTRKRGREPFPQKPHS